MNYKNFRIKRKKVTKVTKINPESEANQQHLVVNYLKETYLNALYCASAGGMFTSKSQAIKMKRTGYVSGFPDLFIYEPRNGYSGLAIEMKKEKGGVVSDNQKQWISDLNERGYVAYVCKGFIDAKKVIDNYFKCE